MYWYTIFLLVLNCYLTQSQSTFAKRCFLPCKYCSGPDSKQDDEQSSPADTCSLTTVGRPALRLAVTEWSARRERVTW